jgi:hypothetical protein
MELEEAKRLYSKFFQDKKAMGRFSDNGFSEKYKPAAQKAGFALYDTWQGRSAEPDVVFVLDTMHGRNSSAIAEFLQELMKQNVLSEKSCVLSEGNSGVLDYSYPYAGKYGTKFSFAIKHRNGTEIVSVPCTNHIAQAYDALKRSKVPFLFNDCLESCVGRRVHRLNSLLLTLEQRLRESPEQAGLRESADMALKQMIETMAERSKYFSAGIIGHSEQKPVVQIFGFADYSHEKVQEKLQSVGLSYAAFVPAPSENEKASEK